MERDDPLDENDGEELEAEIMRADRPFGADRGGTTAEAELTDLSIDDALARERPEAQATDVVVTIEDDGEPDLIGELSGVGSVEEDEFPSAEEAALSIRDRVPGATDHDDPHHPASNVTEERSDLLWALALLTCGYSAQKVANFEVRWF